MTPSNNEIFADAMGCSIALIQQLQHLTSLKFSSLVRNKARGFVGNIDCRYCGQHYKGDICIGLYFNSVIFSNKYQLVLGVKDSNGDYAKKLCDSTINFISHYFASEKDKGRWIFIVLDNYLIYDYKAAKLEINRIISEIL